MTVYPLVFNIGPLELTGFGIMMMLGFFMAGWVIQKELLDKQMNVAYAEQIIIAGVVGGILGAKLWYVALHPNTGALLMEVPTPYASAIELSFKISYSSMPPLTKSLTR